jgi:hypothetical protein
MAIMGHPADVLQAQSELLIFSLARPGLASPRLLLLE